LHNDFSEFFRPNHGHEQIDKQQQGDDGDNDCFHEQLLQFFTKADIQAAQDKKYDHDRDED